MALIAHYRLDGNADDAFGKFNGVATDVTWAAGKLGQAASFDGATSYVGLSPAPVVGDRDFSLAFWANPFSTAAGCFYCTRTVLGEGLSLFWLSGQLRFDLGSQWTPGVALPLNTWSHVVVGAKGGTKFIYVNGVSKGSSYFGSATSVNPNLASVGASQIGGTGYGNFFPGLLDDVRIYDHALSVREIRDLAMGLAVHYPMLDFQEPTENLYQMPAVEGNYFTSAFDGQYGYGANTNAQWVVDNSDQPVAGLPVQKVSRIESGVSQILYLQWDSLFPAKSLAPGQSVTISFWYYGTYGTSIMPYIGGGTGGVVFADSGGGSQVIAVPVRQWHRVSFTLTNPTLETQTYGYGWMRLHHNTETVTLSNQEFWKFTAVQTESKPYPTEYTQGVRSARVIDTSGQGVDAPLALATTPKWIEESPTGRGSYLFTNDATKRIDRPLVDLGSTLTYSCWAMQDSTAGHAYKFIVSSGRDYGGAPQGVNVLSLSGVITVFYGGGAQGNGSLSSGVSVVGVWRHIVFTHDMVNGARLYVDGVLAATGPARTIDYSQAYSRTVIGKMAHAYTSTVNYFPFSGPISDVRLYASALTADQVKELYQQRASLDAQGNFYAQLINERGVTKFQVTKAGQLSSQVSEVGITNGLIAYYPLNKDAQDYSGNGLHGVANGATAVGGGFDGKGAHLFASGNNIVANNVTLGSATSFCMWACMDNATVQMLFSTDRPGGGGCDLFFAGSTISWNTGDSQNNAFKNNGANVTYPSTGVWHHFAVVNDPVSSEARLYIDGVLYGTAAHRDTTQANRRFIVGNYNASTSYAWAGKIANCKVFNRALTAQEIAVEYKRTGPTKMTQHQGVTYIQGEFKEV